MNHTYTLIPKSVNDLTHTDLAADRDAAYDLYGVTRPGDEAPMAAYSIIIDGEAQAAEALIVDTRIGIAWGADATWGDCEPTQRGIERAIDDWIADANAWEARN